MSQNEGNTAFLTGGHHVRMSVSRLLVVVPGLDRDVHHLFAKSRCEVDGLPGHRRAEATPSFRRLCPAMTNGEPISPNLGGPHARAASDRSRAVSKGHPA